MCQTFWDQFNSSIHSNEDIGDVNKFNYLYFFTCDETREILFGIAPTSSNYKTAVDILQKRYGNKQVVVSSFLNKFVTLARVSDIKGLRKLLDQTECSIRNLISLDVTTDRYRTLLVPLINDKLPDNIRISIAKKFDDEIWGIGKLIILLRKEAEAKERSFAIGACFNDCNENDEKFSFSSLALLSQGKNVSKHRCVFFNKNFNKCLKTSETIGRKEIAKQKRLCFLCLEKGHSAVSCKLK